MPPLASSNCPRSITRPFRSGTHSLTPTAPSRLCSALDIDLQKLAHAELEAAAADVAKRYKGASYDWEDWDGELPKVVANMVKREGPASQRYPLRLTSVSLPPT